MYHSSVSDFLVDTMVDELVTGRVPKAKRTHEEVYQTVEELAADAPDSKRLQEVLGDMDRVKDTVLDEKVDTIVEAILRSVGEIEKLCETCTPQLREILLQKREYLLKFIRAHQNILRLPPSRLGAVGE